MAFNETGGGQPDPKFVQSTWEMLAKEQSKGWSSIAAWGLMTIKDEKGNRFNGVERPEECTVC